MYAYSAHAGGSVFSIADCCSSAIKKRTTCPYHSSSPSATHTSTSSPISCNGFCKCNFVEMGYQFLWMSFAFGIHKIDFVHSKRHSLTATSIFMIQQISFCYQNLTWVWFDAHKIIPCISKPTWTCHNSWEQLAACLCSNNFKM